MKLTRSTQKPVEPATTEQTQTAESQASAPVVGSASAPVVGSASAPAGGSASAPVVGSASAPVIGTASAPVVASASAPNTEQGAKVGARQYAERSTGDELTTLAAGVGKTADVAVAYANAGKHELAKRRLGEAAEQLDALKTKLAGETGGLHPGMWTGSQAALQTASAALESAKVAVESTKGVAAVSEGKSTKTRTVLLFGLSANPPTGMGGHAGIVNWGGKHLQVDVPNDEHPELAKENVPMDEVWVMPVYKHLFSSKGNLVDFEHRFAMAKIAFESLPDLEGKVHVSDIERKVITGAVAQAEKRGESAKSVRVGTIDIVEQLMADHPDTQFVLALGGDTYQDLKGGKWKRGDELQQKLPIVVIPRKGVDGVEGSEDNAPQLSDISSTKVRASTDLEMLQAVLHPDVLKYMQEHELYAFAKDASA